MMWPTSSGTTRGFRRSAGQAGGSTSCAGRSVWTAAKSWWTWFCLRHTRCRCKRRARVGNNVSAFAGTVRTFLGGNLFGLLATLLAIILGLYTSNVRREFDMLRREIDDRDQQIAETKIAVYQVGNRLNLDVVQRLVRVEENQQTLLHRFDRLEARLVR